MGTGIEADIAVFENNLSSAIDDVMQKDIENAVKSAISSHVDSDVYKAYTPQFENRRGTSLGSGGIGDTGAMESDYDSATKTLIVRDKAVWQQLWGGSYPSSDLADAVEKGTAKFNMKKAGKRPFAKNAEKDYGKQHFDLDLQNGLKRHGF